MEGHSYRFRHSLRLSKEFSSGNIDTSDFIKIAKEENFMDSVIITILLKGKIDCAGLDLPTLLGEVKKTPMYCLDK